MGQLVITLGLVGVEFFKKCVRLHQNLSYPDNQKFSGEGLHR